MKLCPECNKTEIEDQYKMCFKCLKETKQANRNVDFNEITDLLQKINWNFGTLVKQQRLFYLFQICEKYGEDRLDTRKKIFQYFSQDIEKDLKQLKQIKDEQEK